MGEAKAVEKAKGPVRSPAPDSRALLSPSRHPALASQDALGNAALGRLLRSGRLSLKPAVSEPSDPSEREADLVADRLISGGSCGGCSDAAPCPSCAGGGRGIQRSASASAAEGEAEPDAGRLVSSLGSGIPLAPSLRSPFEAGLGRDLGDVRVHTSAAASDAAHALQARAFTVGNDIAFASGKWTPDTPDGQRLLAHELAHVVDQRASGLSVARDAEKGSSGDEPVSPTVEEEWSVMVDETIDEITDIEFGLGDYEDLDLAEMPKVRARAARKLAILQLFKPTTWEELADLHEAADRDSETEEKTLEAAKRFGKRVTQDPLNVAYGFPTTWSEKLKKAMRSPFDAADLARQREEAMNRVAETGKSVPPHLVAHGLPVDFDTAMELKSFNLFNSGLSLQRDAPLLQFADAARAYQAAYAAEQLAVRYARGTGVLVEEIATGESVVDVTIFPEYEHRRGWQPSVSDLTTTMIPINKNATPDEVNPFVYEQDLYKKVLAVGALDYMTTSEPMRQEYAKRQAEADTQIAGLSGFQRLLLSARWANERGYGSFVRGQLWEQLKEAAPGMLKDAVKEGAIFIGIQFIPIVNWLYDAYQFGKAVVSGAEALYDMYEAEDAVRSATTIVGLQKATARNVLAQNQDILKLAGSLLEAFGNWAAMRAAMKVHLGEALAGGEKAAARIPEKAPAAKPRVSGAVTEAEAAAAKEIDRVGLKAAAWDAAPGHKIRVTKSGLIVRCTQCNFFNVEDLLGEYQDVFSRFEPEGLETWVAEVKLLQRTNPDAAAQAMAEMEQGVLHYRGLSSPVAATAEEIAPTARTALEESSRRGVTVHGMRAAERRASGQWELADEFLTRPNGERILLPEQVDMATGRPLPGTKMMASKPDAVSFRRGMILDDKPFGTDVLGQHRDQLFRYIVAYREATGRMPTTVAVEFYDPATLEPLVTRLYDPIVFVPTGFTP